MDYLKEAQLHAVFPAKIFSKADTLYRNKRISNFNLRETMSGLSMHCKIEDRFGTCDVVVDYDDTSIHGACDCGRNHTNLCEHCCAALLYHCRVDIDAQIPPVKSDPCVSSIINDYIQLAQHESGAPAKQQDLFLLPRFVQNIRFNSKGLPEIGLKIGISRGYVVKDIHEMIGRFRNCETTAYGKNLSITHRMEDLDERSRKLLDLIMASDNQRRSSYYSVDSSESIPLPPASFDRLFDLYVDEDIDQRADDPVHLSVHDPDITLKVRSIRGGVNLIFEGAKDYEILNGMEYAYGLRGRTLYRFSKGFSKNACPILAARNVYTIANADLSKFCSCVLPSIKDYFKLDDPDNILSDFEPEPCTPHFFLDLQKDILTCDLMFGYGDQKYMQSKIPPEVRRDLLSEEGAKSRLIQDKFEQENQRYTLSGNDAVYGFLCEKLDDYRKLGEVMITDRLKNMELRPKTPAVGVSVSDGILSMNLDTGGFPQDELEALYQSLVQRKKYYRLTDGRFVHLNNEALGSIAEMAHMLQLSSGDLKKGTIEMPAYRALYLDNIVGKNSGIKVDRNAGFREMVRRFKEVEDSDYPVPEALRETLRPYQETGFLWLKTLESCGFGGILADEMGLGKTLQVITWLSDVKSDLPSLVVCPTSLVLNWNDEFTKFAPQMRIQLVIGTVSQRKALLESGDKPQVYVTSYDLLKRDIELWAKQSFYACILDEAQFIKNQSTLASKAVKRINCKQRFVLTGTPIENRLSELWNLFDFLMPGYLFAHNRFVEKLEKPIVQSKDDAAQSKLNKLVQPFMLRRLKKDVLKELPPKIEHTRRVQLSEDERKVYYASAQAAKKDLTGSREKLAILAALTRLRQICCDPSLCYENYEGETSKLDACVDLIQSMVENGHQILLFSQFTSMLARIKERLDQSNISNFVLQGDTPKEKRAQLVKSFNEGGASVFLISLKAGGTGLNLTAADVVIHYDPWWNIAAQNQATDRAHRIGQEQCVQVYRLIAQDTIEEKILELQDKKAALLSGITDGESEGILDMTADDLLSLLD